MNVGDVIQRAIVEYYNDPGTINNALKPAMVANWIEKSIMNYWAVFNDNQFGYFSIREQPLLITPASNIYTLPNGNASTTTLTFSGTPVVGNAVYNINGVQVTIPWNITSATLQSLLNTQFSPSNIVVTGGPPGTQLVINWGFVVSNFSLVFPSTFRDINNLLVQCTPVTSNTNIAIVTAMAIKTGTGQNAQYQPISTFFPNTKFGNIMNNGNAGLNAYVYGNTGTPLQWCQESGSPDPFSQLPTNSIRFKPWPNQNLTVVYDGIRYPNKIMKDNTSPIPQPITTQELDLPRHLHDGVVLEVLIEAYMTTKADTSELVELKKEFDAKHFDMETRSVQRQGPETIQTTSW